VEPISKPAAAAATSIVARTVQDITALYRNRRLVFGLRTARH